MFPDLGTAECQAQGRDCQGGGAEAETEGGREGEGEDEGCNRAGAGGSEEEGGPEAGEAAGGAGEEVEGEATQRSRREGADAPRGLKCNVSNQI